MLAALAAISVVASSASAQDRIELEPYSDWVLNYDDDSCALQRQFGEEGQQVYLELRQFGPQTDLQVIIASPDFDRRTGGFEVAFEPLEVELREIERFDFDIGEDYEGKLFGYAIGPAPEMMTALSAFVESAPTLSAEQKELVRRGIVAEPGSRESARLARDGDYRIAMQRARRGFEQTGVFHDLRARSEGSITGIHVNNAFDEAVFLRTGELHAPMEAMRSCLDELLTHWGIDAEAHQSLSRQVEPVDFRNWARRVQEHYPYQMLSRGMQGYLRTRLEVSTDGEVTGCHLQTEVNNDEFERVACDNLMRAKFDPALDAQGQPIDSYYLISVVYML